MSEDSYWSKDIKGYSYKFNIANNKVNVSLYRDDNLLPVVADQPLEKCEDIFKAFSKVVEKARDLQRKIRE